MLWLRITFIILFIVPSSLGTPLSKKVSHKEAAQKLVRVAAAIQNHEMQLSAVEQDLNQTRAEESAILQELDSHNQRLMETIHYLRHATQYSPLLAMLSASKPEDIIHSSMLLRSVTPEIHHRNQQLLEKVKTLSHIRRQLETKQEQLQLITYQYYQDRENLDSLLNARSQTPQTLDENTQADPAEEFTLIKPVVGKLIPTYESTNPEWASFTQGILFVTRAEAQVIAPLSGKIAFAGDYAKGQGKMISIQTPSCLIIMSGLGSLNSNCTVGQNIVAGEPVGRMQKSAKKTNKTAQTMPKLYLEVWRQEQTINPQSVLKEQGMNRHVA